MTVELTEAQRIFPQLVELARTGEKIFITVDGVVKALLTCDEPERQDQMD